jgi:hypothetical protein
MRSSIAHYSSLFLGVLVSVYVFCEHGFEFVNLPYSWVAYWVGGVSAISSWVTLVMLPATLENSRLMRPFLMYLLFFSAWASLATMFVFGEHWSGPLQVLVFAQTISLAAGAAAIL